MKKKFLFAKTWIEYAGFLFVRSIARFLPYAWAGGLGAALSGFVYRCTSIRKRVTMENLSKAFPEKPEREIRRIALGAFRNYGRTILEMFWEWSAPTERIRSIVHLINPEIARNALQDHKGVIILSGHFGSWELLLASSYFTLNRPMTAIVQRQRNKKIDAVVDKNRSRFELHTVAMGQSVREALLCLKSEGVLFLLGDQSGSKESVYVPFFGRPAATHRGPAAFALKTGQVSEVVETKFGYHIIKATDHKDANTVSFEQAKPDIIKRLEETKKGEIANKYVESLKTGANIVYTAEPNQPKAVEPEINVMPPAKPN